MLKERMTLDEPGLTAYRAAREDVAVMDRSAWGRVRMAGEDRVDFLHRMSTNEVRDLVSGVIRQTILTSDIGRIVAIVTAYAFPDHLLLLTDLGGAQRVIGHLERYIFFRDRVELADVTEETGMLSLWGPQPAPILGDIVEPAISDLATDAWVETDFDGLTSIVARTDELGLDGFNLIVHRDHVEPLLHRLTEAGAQHMDAMVYEILRVEAGHPIHGREVGEDFNPLEAGLKPIISFEKGCYIGQEVVARLDTYDKVKQRLIGVRLERLPVAEERPALTSGGHNVGFLTSWVQSPAYGPIALGYVLGKHLEPNLIVEVVDGAGQIVGQVVDLPFF
ncbi:MAG: YgfZ/GcvT domain-containing protein [Anaerolineae bacterium]